MWLGVVGWYLATVLSENLIRLVAALFAVANGSGILPMSKGMDWFVVGWLMIAW